MLEAAELCRRVALAASCGCLWSWRDCTDSRDAYARRICRWCWDPASGGQDLRKRAGCVNGEGK